MTDKKIPYLLALSPILFLIVLLSFNVVMYDNAIGGSNQLALLFSGALAAIIGICTEGNGSISLKELATVSNL